MKRLPTDFKHQGHQIVLGENFQFIDFIYLVMEARPGVEPG